MPWVRIDDGIWSHPKMNSISNDAFSLYICGLSYAGQYLTDGILSDADVERIAAYRHAGPSSIAELVSRHLWEREGLGYRIHDFLTYNRSRAQVEQDRAATAARQERHKSARDGPYNGVTNGVSNNAPGPIPGPGPDPGTNQKSQTISHEIAPNGALPLNLFAVLLERLKTDRNQIGVIGDALTATYGIVSPNYGRIGKMLKEIGGSGEFLKLLFSARPLWNTVDDPLDYLAGAIRKRKTDSNGKTGGRLVDKMAKSTTFDHDYAIAQERWATENAERQQSNPTV